MLKLKSLKPSRAFVAFVSPKTFSQLGLKYCVGTMRSKLKRRFKLVADRNCPDGQIHLIAYGRYQGSWMVGQINKLKES